jgi:hypothetical protein
MRIQPEAGELVWREITRPVRMVRGMVKFLPVLRGKKVKKNKKKRKTS